TDAHSNTTTHTFTITVVDTTAPVITTPGNQTVEATSAGGANVPYTVTATDTVDGPVSVNCVPPPGSLFPLGTTTVHCTATDAHGNSSTASSRATVEHTPAPGIPVPADITAEATGPGGAVVGYMTNASDAVGVTSFACVPPAGSTFPLGTTTVTCTASDAA